MRLSCCQMQTRYFWIFNSSLSEAGSIRVWMCVTVWMISRALECSVQPAFLGYRYIFGCFYHKSYQCEYSIDKHAPKNKTTWAERWKLVNGVSALYVFTCDGLLGSVLQWHIASGSQLALCCRRVRLCLCVSWSVLVPTAITVSAVTWPHVTV